jgi:ribosomal protein S18 acetylase RimI-like enzyme
MKRQTSIPLVLEPSWTGRRVSVRRVIERAPDGRLLFGDVVGDLVGLDAQTAVIDSRSGYVEVPVALIAVARLVPPSAADEIGLAEIAARGWRAAETDRLGGWLLRASGGFTSRGNSVLPLRTPGLPLDDALGRAGEWYRARGLPLKFQVPVESRRLLDAELAERGWPAGPDVHVMTTRLDLRPVEPAEPDVVVTDVPDESWLLRCRNGGGMDPDAQALLTRHDKVAFAAVRDSSGTSTAIGRATVDDGWLGVTAVEVAAELRRTGLARSIMRALVAWGVAAGAKRSHLSVAADNVAALALYESLGYRTHHDYRYRTDPAALERT